MNEPRNIRLSIQFDGTNYCGWLYQKHSATVQGAVSDAISGLTGSRVELIGCSRTDSGVHAAEYVLNFTDTSSIPVEKYPAALNSFLPDDIVCKSASIVPDDFHATYSATGKTYRYYFYSAPHSMPLINKNAWYIGSDYLCTGENLADLNNSLKVLCGEHDFSSFRAMGGLSKTTVRTIYNINITHEQMNDIRMYCLEVSGNGFLYNMVRIITGTVVDIIKKRINPGDLSYILESCDRRQAGMTAPAQGLYLWSVEY